MADVMTLDLKAHGDDLLVPFGRESNKSENTESSNHNPLYAPPPVHRQNPMRTFFRRRQQQKSNESQPEDDEEQANATKQQVTFKFPTAPQAFAEDEETDDPYKDNPATTPSMKPSQPKKKKDESSDEDSSSSSDEEPEQNENDRENRQPPARRTRDGLNAAPTSSYRTKSFNELKHEWKKDAEEEAKRVPMEGHGNSQPDPDTPISAMGRMFRRIGRRSDMKSMKIATEDTKDERTFGETVTHVCQVALVPEVYADDMEGEGNLGFYRPVRSAPPKRNPVPPAQQRLLDSVSKWKKDNDLLRKKVVALRDHVDKLEEEMKVKDIETAVWKLRAQELEEELRKYKGDDNSTTGPTKAASGNGDESEDGIDHEWQGEPEEPPASVKEELLVDTTFVPEKITFDPLKETGKEEPSEICTTKKEEEQHGKANECEEGASKDYRGRRDATEAGDVEEEVLVDTNFVPEPVVFDPMRGSSMTDGGEEDRAGVLDLIVSLGADVEDSGERVPVEESEG